MKKILIVFQIYITAFFISAAYALEVSDIAVVGLFRDTAVLRIAGKQKLLKVGQANQYGITLVSASNAGAVLLLNGQKHLLTLSTNIHKRYVTKQKASELIAINAIGQYITHGSINGQSVSFLIDTGATSIAMNSREARRLGINFASAKPSQVITAGGPVKAYSLMLKLVKVGELEGRNIKAVVLEGNYPRLVLLGMSWLQHVEIIENAGVMKLTKKY